MRKLNDRTPGLPVAAFGALIGLAAKVEGEPVVIGPYDPIDEGTVPTIRTIGFRRDRAAQPTIPLPAIMHAKLALLGHLWWHDEGPLGHVDDVIGFKPRRLWVSSANFTTSSRSSLEFGFWMEDKGLVQGAEWFLTTALRYSEGLDPESDAFEPELVPVMFDDDAFREVLAEMNWDDDDDDPI